MKRDIHISIETDILSDLNAMCRKMRMARSILLEAIIVKGIQDIEELNYNFMEFINK